MVEDGSLSAGERGVRCARHRAGGWQRRRARHDSEIDRGELAVRDVRVATVQFQHAPGDKAYNLGRVRHFVTEAARQSVEIIVFPEMCLTGYWHVRKLARAAFEALAEPVDGPCTQELLRLAREHGMTVGAGLLERTPEGHVYNAYAVSMQDGTVAVHRKLPVSEPPSI